VAGYVPAMQAVCDVYCTVCAAVSLILQLGTVYQQPLKTVLHRRPISAAISNLNYLAGLVALIHRCMFMIA